MERPAQVALQRMGWKAIPPLLEHLPHHKEIGQPCRMSGLLIALAVFLACPPSRHAHRLWTMGLCDRLNLRRCISSSDLAARRDSMGGHWLPHTGPASESDGPPEPENS
jgi:hypothetical protein